MQIVVDRTIVDLDQTLTIITAILRLSEIEGAGRQIGFETVSLDGIVREVGDLYSPVAEAKSIALALESDVRCSIYGDRDLLIEAVANLLDNAIKFTPEYGAIRVSALADRDGRSVVRIADTGPGIPKEEREAVVTRFYRSDRSRHIEGSGLGLSLVAAIARLHDLSLVIKGEGPGCVIELAPNLPSRRAPVRGLDPTMPQQRTTGQLKWHRKNGSRQTCL